MFFWKKKVKLDDFFDGIKEIKYKNNGGCLMFCYTFWRWLEENDLPKEDFDIVQYSSKWERSIGHNTKWINQEIDGFPISSSHFSWIYKGEEYDGDGLLNKSRYIDFQRAVLHGLKRDTHMIKYFCIDALLYSTWNFVFQRGPAIEVIESNLNLDLSELKVEDSFNYSY